MEVRELDIANQNRDRQIYPVIGPGPEPGTSALTLRVKDRLPIHGRLEVNNQTPPGTPEWRVNTSVQHRNLWQREHQAGLSYGFAPEAMKLEAPNPDFLLNRPQVAFYGGYYRLPFGHQESVEEQVRPGVPRAGGVRGERAGDELGAAIHDRGDAVHRADEGAATAADHAKTKFAIHA